MKNFEYTIYIRTLGTAGEKYQALLNAIGKQTIRPQRVVVVIPYGYELPKERLGYEEFLRSDKGMITQRIAGVSECKTEYALFLDDDLDFGQDFVEILAQPLIEGCADVVFPIEKVTGYQSLVKDLFSAITASAIPVVNSAYFTKVTRFGGFRYNKKPNNGFYKAETGQGTAFLCRTNVMQNIRFDEELWLQNTAYPLPEDQVMYYKMVKRGYHILATQNVLFAHLDAGGSSVGRREKAVLAMACNKTIFWHRFIYLPDKNVFSRILSIFCYGYYVITSIMLSILRALFKGNLTVVKCLLRGYSQGIVFLNSEEYKKLPKI